MNLTEYCKAKGGTGTIKCMVMASTAQAAGTSAAYLYLVSRGHKKPSAAMAKRISAATGGEVTTHVLLPEIFDPVPMMEGWECAGCRHYPVADVRAAIRNARIRANA